MLVKGLAKGGMVLIRARVMRAKGYGLSKGLGDREGGEWISYKDMSDGRRDTRETEHKKEYGKGVIEERRRNRSRLREEMTESK